MDEVEAHVIINPPRWITLYLHIDKLLNHSHQHQHNIITVVKVLDVHLTVSECLSCCEFAQLVHYVLEGFAFLVFDHVNHDEPFVTLCDAEEFGAEGAEFNGEIIQKYYQLRIPIC